LVGRHPAIVHLHGGPTAQFLRDFDLLTQALVRTGFVVLAANVRGSTGYGSEHRDACLGDWGGADLDDVVQAADYLERLDYVDGSQLGVFGESYGAYLALLAVTRYPARWKCAAALMGFTDLASLYQTTTPSVRRFLREQMGDPDGRRDLWRERSPLTHAARLKAPLLVVRGRQDPRCPLDQIQQLCQVLHASGKVEGRDYELLILPNSGHSTVLLEHRRTLAAGLVGHFLRNMGVSK